MSLEERLRKLELKYKPKTQLVFLVNPTPAALKAKGPNELQVVMKI